MLLENELHKFPVTLVFFFFLPLTKKISSHFVENQSSNELETYLPNFFLATGRFIDVLNIRKRKI